MQTAAQLKELVLDMMESAFQSGDVKAVQQMGVSLSTAVKREGVTIIQNQHVEVMARLMPLMIKALKVCDDLDVPTRSSASVQIEPAGECRRTPGPAPDPIEDCCSWLYENRIGWQQMQELMRARYLEHVTSRFRTKKEAARWLGVGNTYLSKLTAPANTR
jgi:hypothetical protein